MKTEKVARIARCRAAWNKDHGGVLLTGEYGRSDHNGSHYRVVADGGNEYNGRKQWILSRASGGNYCLEDAAMSVAVALVLGVGVGPDEDDIHESSWNGNWEKVARMKGWTLYSWEAANTVVLIPNETVAKEILDDYHKRMAEGTW